MVLDIPKYLENLIKKEMKVSHFSGSVNVGMTKKLKPNIKAALQKQFGDTFLADANYLAIFLQEDTSKAAMKKLFELVNRALGKDANNMTQSDFKLAKYTDAEAVAEDDEDVESPLEEPEEPTEPEEPAGEEKNFIFMKITIK